MRKQRIASRAVPLFAALLLASPALGRAVTDVEGAWYGPAVTKVVVKRVGAADWRVKRQPTRLKRGSGNVRTSYR